MIPAAVSLAVRDDEDLVLKREAGEIEIVERWSHEADSSRRVVDVEVRGRLPRDIALRRVYERDVASGR